MLLLYQDQIFYEIARAKLHGYINLLDTDYQMQLYPDEV